MLVKKRSVAGAIIAGALSIGILAAAGWLVLNRQYAMDQISVWSYTPSSSIQTIDERVDFTANGKFHFYATQPQVDGSDKFNQDCPRQEVGNPILGCYTGEHRIFIYNVENTQLDGIEEVTAAHEMLHAVWERTSPSDQAKIGALIRAEYQKHTDDPELKERMDYYQRTEPGQFINELHSILATETRSLSPELETYYGKYFNDRQKIVDLHDKYDAVFKDLKARSDSLYVELTTLGASIETRTTKYNTDVAQLSADIEAFNGRANSGDFSSISQFNQQRAELITRSNQVDADRAAISGDIDTYNAKYEQYQELSSQIEVLNKSIDSIKDLQPTPSV